MLEGAKAKTETVDALKTGASAMKAMQKTTNIDDIDKTMDEINKQTENMKQFQEVLSAPIGSAADFDEDELEAELEELECAELEEQLLQPVPIHVPQRNKPNVVTLGQQSSFNISDLHSDNLVGDDRRKDRLVVPSHGQDSVLFKRPPSSHCSSSHERLLERMSDSASRTAASSYGGIEGGARRKLGATWITSETSFSEMLKKSNSMKKVAEESSDATEGSKGGGVAVGRRKERKGGR